MSKKFTHNFFNYLRISTFFMLIVLGRFDVWSQGYTPPTYCTPSTANVGGYGIGVSRVTLSSGSGSSINNSTGTPSSAPTYFNYSDSTLNATANGTITGSVLNGNSNSTQVKIYIDYNQDGTFGTSSPELAWTSGTTAANSSVSVSFTVPSGQAVGAYRMRIVGDFGGGPSGNPCATNYGDVEDYTLVVTTSTSDAIVKTFTAPVPYFVSGNNTIAFGMYNLTNTTMTSVDIGYKLDNNSAVTQSLSSLTVPAGGYYNATFSTQLNISSVGTYTLKMWLNNVNGGGTQTASNDTIYRTFTYCNSLSGNYTIDPSGSGSTNFKRFGEADSAMMNCGISGPVVFTVAAGTYTEQFTSHAITGASPTNTITYTGGSASNAASRILTFSSTASGASNFTLKLLGKYTRFTHLTINATNSSFATALAYTTGAARDSFYNVTFNSVTTTSTSNNYAVITAIGNPVCDSIRFDTCRINNGSYGSIAQSTTTNSLGASSRALWFNNCDFVNQYAYGMYNNQLDGFRATNNRITTNSSYTGYNGIYNYWIMVLSDASKTVVTGNKITGGQGGYGIYATYFGVNSSSNSARRFLIANNFIQIGTGSNTAVGIYDNYANGADYIHNSINVGTSQNTNSSGAAQFVGTAFGGNTIQNNIFSCNNGAPCIRVDNFTYYSTINYNQYYTSGSNFAYIGGSASASFGAWKSASTKDANSFNSIPTFTSSTDLHISSVCNNGTNLSSLITTDIDGQSRPSVPDIGADENTSSPGDDVGVVSITSPGTSVTAGSQALKAVVKNFGTNSVSSLTISYTNNGGSVTSQTFNFSPSLAQCDTATVTFTSNVTIATGSNLIKVYTAMSGDAVLGNDTFINTFCTSMSGSYTINPGAAASTTNFQSYNAAVTQMLCSGLSGAVTFTVSNGTYNESISLGNFNGNSSTNTITFTSASGNPALCVLQGASASASTVYMGGADYVTFSNIGFLTSTLGNSRNIEFGGGSNNNTFSGCVFNSTSSTSNYHIYEQSVVDDFNTFTNNTYNAVGYGMYMSTNGTRDKKWVISGCTFNNQFYAGIYLNFADSINILNNTFTTSSATTYYSMYIANAGNAIKVIGNNITLSGTSNYGIYFTSVSATSTTRFKIANNVVRGSTNGYYGIYLQSGSFFDVVHNTVYWSGSALTTSGCMYMASNSNFTIKNNLFSNNAAGYAVVIPAGNTFSAAGVMDYNNYLTTGTNIGQVSGTNQTTYANFVSGINTAAGTTQNASSSNKTPNFVSAPSNLNIGDGCITGVSGTGFTTDILGTTRSGSTPNSGAYEYSSLSDNLTVVAIRTPVSPFSAGATNVIVTIKNVGNNSVSSGNISYKYDNGSAVSQTLSTTLNPCDTLQVTFNSTSGAGATDQRLTISSGLHYLKAYTSSPNGNTDNNLNNDTVGFTTCTGGVSGNFTIDASSPSSTSNFQSFTTAVAAITSCGGISGPVKFTVAAGTYTEQVDLTSISGLSSTNTLTFDGGNGNASTRILQASGTGSLPYTIRINNLNYISIKNLTIRGNSGNAWPVHILGSTSASTDTIKNCIIDFGSTAVSSFNSTNYMGIVLNGNATTYSTVGTFNNIVIDSNTINGGYANIMVYANNNSSTNANQFTGNALNNAYQYGAFLQGINGGTFDRNTINMNTNLTSSTGLYLNSASAIASTNTWSIQRNKIINAGQYGIFMASSAGFSSSRGKMYNNLIGGGFRSTGLNGIYFQSSSYNWDVFHNTVNLDFASNSTSSSCIYMGNCCTTGTATLDVRNNIFAVTATGSTAMPFYLPNGYPYSVIGTTSFDYNLFYVAGATSTTNYGYSGGTYLTASTVLGNSSYNTNSVIANPYFNSSTDLHIGNATNNVPQIAAVTADYSGTSRGSSTDMGAYETPAPNNDIGISAITAPSFPISSGNSNITVTLKNYGANTVTSATVYYSVNGGSAVSVSLSSLSIAAGGTGTYTFTGGNQFNFAINTVYTIKAYTSSPNGVSDAFVSNDTFTSIPLGVALCGNYTINQGVAASSSNFTSFTSAVNMLNAGGVSCAVNFTVMGSTAYNEQVELNTINGASTTNTITFDGGSGNAANRTIYFAASSQSAAHTIRITNTPGVSIRNLTVQATGSTYGWPVHINGSNSNYAKVKNCIINYGSGNGTNSTSSNYVGIVINNNNTSFQGAQTNSLGFEIDSNTISGGYVATSLYCGVYYNSTRWYFRSNNISNTYQYGIYAYGNATYTISRNNVVMRTGVSNSSGISINFCYGGYGSEISYNVITNAGQYGIYNFYTLQNSASTPGRMFNNLVGGGFSNTSSVGIYTANNQYWNIDYNTVNLDVATSAATWSAFYVDPSYSNAPTNIRNNIFACTAGSGSQLSAYFGLITGLSSFTYNDFYNAASTNLVYHNGTTYTTANYTTPSANSVNINPSFTSSTNLRHSTSALKAGTPVSGISDDIDGRSRNATTPYIGGYEIPQPNDLGANALLSPVLPTVAGTYDVRIKFKNLGSNTATAGTVGYKLNSNSAVTASWSGSLSALDTSSINFSGGNQITINAGSSNTLKIWAVATGDGDNTNDTITYTICPGLRGTYTIDTTQAASTTNFKSFGSAINALNGCGGVAGAVVFNVSANTYAEQVTIGAINFVSATNTVTFNGAGTSSTLLTFATTNANPNVVRFNGTQFVNFRNMAIKSSTTSDGWILHYMDAKNCKVSKCLIEFSNSTAQTSSGSNLHCVVVNGSASTLATASTISDSIYVDSNIINYGYSNVYLSASSGTVNPTMYVRGDSMTNAYFASIMIPSTHTIVYKVLNNRITLRTGASGQFGFYCFANNPNDANKYNEISGNRMSSLNGNAIGLWYGGATGGSSARGIISNNVLGGNSRGATTLIGYNISCCTNTQYWNIYNNTFILDYTSGTSYGYNALTMSGSTQVNLKNNIFVNTSTAANNIAINASSGAITTVDYNNFYTAYSGGILASIGGVNITANNYRAAWPSGLGLNSLNANVSFLSTSDFHHTTACLRGQTGLGITTDLDGASRTTPPDMGAYNASNIPANDIGIFSISAPSVPVTGGSQSLRAVFKNYGTNAVSSAKVYYSFNNVLDSQTFSFSPSLNGCDTTTITFSNNINIAAGVNNIKVYTALSGDASKFNDTIQNNYCISYTGNYTIDPNTAASATNFQTFSAAVAALSCGGVSGPVVFSVAAGTYNEQVDIGAIYGASATNTITFDGGTGNNATRVLTYNSTSTNFTLRLLGSNFFKFKNLTISAQSSSLGTALYFGANASSDSFYNVTFNGVSTTTNSTNMAVVYSPGTTNVSNYISFDTCRFNFGYYGTFIQSSSSNTLGSSSQGLSINNCDFNNQYGYGMYNQYLDGIKITKNRIVTNSTINSYNGMYNYWIMYLSDAAKPIVTGNKISGGQGGYGMRNEYFGVNSSLNAARRPLIANNFVQIGSSSNATVGIYEANNQGADYIHNSVNVTTTQQANTSMAAYFASTGFGSNTIQNNIFAGTAGAASIRIDNSTYYSTANYNLLSTTGATLGYYGTTAYATMATWRTASSRDANSITNAPSFVSTSDLHITNKACLDNLGTNLTSLLTVDIDNNSRSTTPDLGASEFSSTAYDVTTRTIISPSSTAISASTNYTITVRVRNNGSTAVTSVAMNYSINGTVTSETFTPGSAIQPCDSATFSFTTQATFASGASVFKVYTGNINGGNTDLDHTNDTIQTIFCTPYTGTITVNPAVAASGTNFTSISSAIATLYNCGVGGNMIVNIANGVYNENLSFVGKIPGTSPTATVTFRPASGDTGVYINALSSHAIALNGAKYIIFDGRAGGTGTSRIMNISNTNSTFASAYLVNDAIQDTFRYCNLNSNAGTTLGTVFISTTSATYGNDSNTIENCVFNMSSANPAIHLFASGTAAKENDYITIRNNNFLNAFLAGSTVSSAISTQGNDRYWNILNNNFTQTSINIPSGAITTNLTSILINSATEGGHLIQGNRIGGSIPGISGSVYQLGNSSVPAGQLNQLLPIRLGASSSTNPIKIYANTINNMKLHTNYTVGVASGFLGILVSSGNVEIGGDGPSTGNIIGDTGVARSIEVFAYNATQGQRTNGIRILGAGSSHTHYIRSNTIKNLYNGYTGSSVSNQTVGIIAGTATSVASFKIDSNIVTNLVSNDSNVSVGATASTIGIELSSSTSQANPEILRNTISNLSNSKGNTSIYGIMNNNSGTGSQIGRNLIVGLTNSSTTGTGTNISGILNFAGNGVTISNNVISLTQNTGTASLVGIADNSSANTQNYFLNTVYTAGTQSGVAANSSSFARTGSGSTMNIRNNIFYNAHTSSGTNYNMAIPSAWSSSSSLNNFFVNADSSAAFYISGTATTRGFGSWAANVSDGSGTSSANSTLNTPASILFANVANNNFNVVADYCNVNNRGTSVATTVDYTNSTRSGTPDIGAFELSMNYDMGVSSFVNPTSGYNKTSTEQVKVYVKNTSSTTTIPSGFNFKAGYKLNGNLMSIQNFVTTSALNVGDSQLITFTTTANIATYANYTFKAWTQICDASASNDTSTKVISNQLGDDLGVTTMVTPTYCTYGPNQTVSFRFRHNGFNTIDMSTNNVIVRTRVTLPNASIASLPDVVLNSGNLNHNDSILVTPSTTFNMSNSGTYIFKSYTVFASDPNHTNDTIVQSITVEAPNALPYIENFNSGTSTPNGWTLSGGFNVNSGVGAFSTNGLRVHNSASGNLNGVVRIAKVGSLISNSAIMFDYKITDASGGSATTLSAQDSVLVQVSADCGVTYNTVSSINTSNHSASTSYTSNLVSLSAYNGQNVIIRLISKTTGSSSNDYNVDIDNINVFNQANMTYVSSIVTQGNLTNVTPGTSDAEVLGLKIVTTGNISPLTVTSVRVHTQGTTNVADLTDAKLYFTSNNSTYSISSTQVGSTVSSPSGFVTFNLSSPVTLGVGDNYFWLSYSIPSNATIGNKIDAYVDYATINSINRIPSPKSPAGDRMIYYCEPVHATACASGYIDGIKLGTINNTGTGCSSSYSNSWSNYYKSTVATQTTTLRALNDYVLTFNNSNNAQKVAMWIDYDRNGIYDASEYSLVSSNVSANATATYTLSIPATVTTGVTGMRIRSIDSASSIGSGDACTSFASGETEDYRVTLVSPCNWVGGVSTDWNNAANWASNTVPTSIDNVTIPSGTTFSPTVNTTANTRDLSPVGIRRALEKARQNAVPDITGTGKVLMNNNTVYQSISGTGSISNLEMNTAAGSGVRVTNNTNITDSLILTQGTFTLNTAVVVTVGSTTSANSTIFTTGGSIVGSGSGNSSSLVVLGNSSAPKITNFKFSTSGNFTLNRPSGIQLGGNMVVTNASTLTNGRVDMNGYNFTIGNTALALGTITGSASSAITNSQNSGTLLIQGNASASVISNLYIDTLYAMTINREAGVSLGNSFYVTNLLSLQKGDLNLNGKNIVLGSSASLSEIAGNNVKGSSGYITTTRNLSSALTSVNVAGLGLKLTTSGAPANTNIKRGHTVYTNGSGGSSISRY
ncbi:MAG: hypothetical protein HYZ42_10035, partial [Bacteroidetes bacterium]|nr:hypothetical protein [Bacteroidota bacterium]